MPSNPMTVIAPRRAGLALVALLAFSAVSVDALAQAWPSRPVKLIAPYAAGGPTDVMARLFAVEMSKTLGQSVVVENRPGAAGALGADVVAKSAPDGYTVCFCTTGPTVLMPLLEPKLPYNAARDLPPVAYSHRTELSVLLGPRVPATVKTLADLIALARANPGKISFASPGSGSPNHMAGELLSTMAKIDLLHVPYKGEAPAMVDLLGGQVDVLMASVLTGEPQVKAGKVRMIAVTGPARVERYPDVPTVGETLPGYEATSHVGLHVPAGTPREAIDKLGAALFAAIAQPAVREKMISEGITPAPMKADAYAAYLRRESDKWQQVIRQQKIRLD
jgi:tripartite-type tricarboxylate transporter receptor subunit TctC